MPLNMEWFAAGSNPTQPDIYENEPREKWLPKCQLTLPDGTVLDFSDDGRDHGDCAFDRNPSKETLHAHGKMLEQVDAIGIARRARDPFTSNPRRLLWWRYDE